MAYTLQSPKANGGNITRAELVTFLTNLEWFRTGPSYRLYDSDGGETVETTIGVMAWATGHYEWREGGGGDPDNGTYNTGTSGLYVNVGDVADGVWVNGVMFAIEQPPDVDAAVYRVRRVQLRRGDGSVWTEMADQNVHGDYAGRQTSLHLFGAGTFSTGTDRVQVRARTDEGSLDVLRHRQWGFRVGSATDYTGDFAAARPVSDTNDELTAAWNQLRLNHARIERRPSAQRWKSGSAQATTASTEATITMASSDWASDTGMTANVDRLDVQQSGIYFVSGQATLPGFNTGLGFATLALQHVTGADIVSMASANSPDMLPASSESTTVTACDLVEIDAGRYIRQTILTSADESVEASRGTHLHAHLMSSSSGVSPGRQVFAQMPHPDTWPDVANYSSAHLPAGTLRVLSDLTDRCWHVPAFKASLGDDVEVDEGAGWVDIDCDVPVFDYTSLETLHGITVFSNGGLVLPWAGTWLVGARLSFRARSAGGRQIGNEGTRGMRLALGEKRAAGAIVGRAMNAAAHGWTRTIAETVVTNADGTEVKLQAQAAQSADSFDAAVVTSAHIWAVELGEGVTRVPR